MTGSRILFTMLAAAAGVAAGVSAWLLPSYRRETPAARERRRRLAVWARGRVTSAVITEAHENVLSYRYSIGGIEYSASQDVSTVRGLLPSDLSALTERATAIKYLVDNPANSIVVCERWSGLDFPRSAART
jgi:hypothetical protein